VLNSYFSGEKKQKFTPEENTELPDAFKMFGSYLNIQLGAIQVDVFNGWLCDHATWVREQSQTVVAWSRLRDFAKVETYKC
jgi:hypothetical protein